MTLAVGGDGSPGSSSKYDLDFWILLVRHLMSESVGRLTAIELSPGMLAEAPDPEGLTMDRLTMDLDGAELPFADNSVDLVTSCLAMHWINDLPGLFREVQRILKPDGVFIGEIAEVWWIRPNFVFNCLQGQCLEETPWLR